MSFKKEKKNNHQKKNTSISIMDYGLIGTWNTTEKHTTTSVK